MAFQGISHLNTLMLTALMNDTFPHDTSGGAASAITVRGRSGSTVGPSGSHYTIGPLQKASGPRRKEKTAMSHFWDTHHRGIQRSRPPGPLGSEVAYQSMRTAPERAISCKALRPGRTYLTLVLGQIQALRDKERSMKIAGSTIRKSTSKSIRCLSRLANSSSLIR